MNAVTHGDGLSRRTLGLALLGAAVAPTALKAAEGPNIFFLSGSNVMTSAFDGSGIRVLCTGKAGGLNDGIAYDPVLKRIFWSNMGRANDDDGFIQSCKPDGTDLQMVAPPGSSFTPKQLKIDVKGRKLYWCDREGMRVMRCNMDGSKVEVLLQTGAGETDRQDTARWCVGIALDEQRGQIYWTQKGGEKAGPGRGSIRRMGINLPAGQTPTTRKDVEVLFSGLPEPIDMDVDLAKRTFYWTDRSDATVSCAPMDAKGFDPAKRTDRKILVRNVDVAIGMTLDLANRRMAYTGLTGNVGTANMDGSNAKTILQKQGTLTGIIML